MWKWAGKEQANIVSSCPPWQWREKRNQCVLFWGRVRQRRLAANTLKLLPLWARTHSGIIKYEKKGDILEWHISVYLKKVLWWTESYFSSQSFHQLQHSTVKWVQLLQITSVHTGWQYRKMKTDKHHSHWPQLILPLQISWFMRGNQCSTLLTPADRRE